MTPLFSLAGKTFQSRLILGTSRYPSPATLASAIQASSVEVVTVALRRQQQGGDSFWELIRNLGVTVLPNTAGCRSVKEAVTTAHLAREVFGTSWIKLEVIGEEYQLLPDPFALVEAARQLCREGFEVFPYMTADLVLAERLMNAGCRILMPLGSPIGTGKGLADPMALHTLRVRFPQATLILDAGIGKPSQAVQAMELGFDGVLLNTAVATSTHPEAMAKAFALAVQAGRLGYEAGLMSEKDSAVPSTPVIGTPFWQVSSS